MASSVIQWQAQFWVWTFTFVASCSINTLVTAAAIWHSTLVNIWTKILKPDHFLFPKKVKLPNAAWYWKKTNLVAIIMIPVIVNSPVHETDLALFVHWPFAPHCLSEGPCSWYPCGHENEQVLLILICDVTQLLGDVLTRRPIFKTGHLATEIEQKRKQMYC